MVGSLTLAHALFGPPPTYPARCLNTSTDMGDSEFEYGDEATEETQPHPPNAQRQQPAVQSAGPTANSPRTETQQPTHWDDNNRGSDRNGSDGDGGGRSSGIGGGGGGSAPAFDTAPMHNASPLATTTHPSNPGIAGVPPDGAAYDPAAYVGLHVPPEVADLFALIGRYRPAPTSLDTPLRPFIPDYMAAVGAPDAFLKPPRPDGKDDPLGLRVVDEPALHQSDAVVLELHLRAMSKRSINANEAIAVRGRAEFQQGHANLPSVVEGVNGLKLL